MRLYFNAFLPAWRHCAPSVVLLSSEAGPAPVPASACGGAAVVVLACSSLVVGSGSFRGLLRLGAGGSQAVGGLAVYAGALAEVGRIFLVAHDQQRGNEQ